MSIPQETLEKMNKLQDDQMNFVITLVDQLSRSPMDIFDSLCEQGQKEPMSDDEINHFVSQVRSERRAKATGH